MEEAWNRDMEGQQWGKGHQRGGTGGARQPKPEVPVPAKVPFSPLPLVLLLMVTSWLFLTHCSWERLQIVDENAAKECGSFSVCLFVWAQTAGPRPLSHLCTSPSFSFFFVAGKPKAHFPGSYWHHHSCMPLSSLTSAKALWNSCLVSSRIWQQKQLGTIGRYGWAWDMAVLQETAAADHSCVVSSSCSCLMSLQKHYGTVGDPKAKNAPFNRKWSHQFYLKTQSLLHKGNPKSSGNVLFLVVSFYSFSSKIHVILQRHPLNLNKTKFRNSQ